MSALLVVTDAVLFLKGGAGSGWRSPLHGGTHVKRAPHNEGGDGGGSIHAQDDFVTGPNGSIDFGSIAPDVAMAIKRQPGKIRLPRGIHNADGTGYGLAHIEAGHGKHIRGAGFASVEEFVLHVATDFGQVWQASGRQLLVAVRDGKQHMTYVQLEPATDGDYYRVNTAFPVRQSDYPEKHGFNVLWPLSVGSEPATTATGKRPAFASETGNSSGQSVPNARSNIGKTTIPKKLNKSMPDYTSLTHYRFPHEPTPAQIQAGNYPKRKVAWNGLTISVENEAGSVRRGTKPDGSPWETRMVFSYGYVLGSRGVDGDHVDCYLGPDESAPMAYVIHQRKAGTWDRYDEDKVMLQFASQEEAERAFLLHYNDPRFLGPVTAMPVDEFKQKVLAAAGRMVKSFSCDSQNAESATQNILCRVGATQRIPDYGQAMLKSKGNPRHDPKTGQFTAAPVDGNYSAWLPPSSGIGSLAEAKTYYQKHLRGVWTLVINRKAGPRNVKVDLRENEEHAYTKNVNGQREFWPERAKKMSAIIQTMAHPGVVLENGNRDLFVERASAGGHEVVVLEWKEATKDYRFRSFHYWSEDEYRKLIAPTERGGYKRAKLRGITVQKDETPIRKSVGVPLGEHSGFESPPNFPNLHRTSLAGSFELGGAHAGIGWPHADIIGYVADVVKAMEGGVTELFRYGCGDSLSFEKRRDATMPDAPDYGQHMLKSEHGPIPAGAHWITVNSHGAGKGSPILVMPHEDGSMRVIGGAGGALNHLKLHSVKTGESYKDSSIHDQKLAERVLR